MCEIIGIERIVVMCSHVGVICGLFVFTDPVGPMSPGPRPMERWTHGPDPTMHRGARPFGLVPPPSVPLPRSTKIIDFPTRTPACCKQGSTISTYIGARISTRQHCVPGIVLLYENYNLQFQKGRRQCFAHAE